MGQREGRPCRVPVGVGRRGRGDEVGDRYGDPPSRPGADYKLPGKELPLASGPQDKSATYSAGISRRLVAKEVATYQGAIQTAPTAHEDGYREKIPQMDDNAPELEATVSANAVRWASVGFLPNK